MSAAVPCLRLDASAPGKVVLAGEYAVLAGAPALAMAVNRRARVTLEAGTGDGWRMTTPGFRSGETRFSALDSEHAADDVLALPGAVFAGATLPSAAGRLRIDTNALHDEESGRKLGLGSSAAACAALMAARLALETKTDNGQQTLFARTHAAHRDFQSGRGSGVDVATAVYGGVLTHRMQTMPRSERWPDGLQVALLWSGQPASTTRRLRTFEQTAADPALDDLSAAAEAIATQWRAGDSREIQEGLANYAAALADFDRRTRLGIFAAGHDDVAALAAGYESVVYKPCGAGGGDIGAAFSTDPDALATFSEAAAELGFRKLAADRDPVGARLEVQQS